MSAAVSFDPDLTYVIRPTTLDVRESYATYCRLGAANAYTVFAGSNTGSPGTCDQEQIIAEGPVARVRLADGQLAGVFTVAEPSNGRFARVVDSYNLGGSIPVTDQMPLHRFRSNAVHVLAASAESEAAFQRAVLGTFPSIQQRLSGEITETIAPKCKANASSKLVNRIASLSCEVLRGNQIAGKKKPWEQA